MRNGHVLVVEDDDVVRKLLVDFLGVDSPVDVDAARDGADALHRISTKAYAVVVLDLMMPFMSGIDFLTSLEAMTSDPSVRSLETPPAVVIITATPDAELPNEELIRASRFVRGVFRKPLDMRALASYLDEM